MTWERFIDQVKREVIAEEKSATSRSTPSQDIPRPRSASASTSFSGARSIAEALSPSSTKSSPVKSGSSPRLPRVVSYLSPPPSTTVSSAGSSSSRHSTYLSPSREDVEPCSALEILKEIFKQDSTCVALTPNAFLMEVFKTLTLAQIKKVIECFVALECDATEILPVHFFQYLHDLLQDRCYHEHLPREEEPAVASVMRSPNRIVIDRLSLERALFRYFYYQQKTNCVSSLAIDAFGNLLQDYDTEGGNEIRALRVNPSATGIEAALLASENELQKKREIYNRYQQLLNLNQTRIDRILRENHDHMEHSERALKALFVNLNLPPENSQAFLQELAREGIKAFQNLHDRNAYENICKLPRGIIKNVLGRQVAFLNQEKLAERPENLDPMIFFFFLLGTTPKVRTAYLKHSEMYHPDFFNFITMIFDFDCLASFKDIQYFDTIYLRQIFVTSTTSNAFKLFDNLLTLLNHFENETKENWLSAMAGIIVDIELQDYFKNDLSQYAVLIKKLQKKLEEHPQSESLIKMIYRKTNPLFERQNEEALFFGSERLSEIKSIAKEPHDIRSIYAILRLFELNQFQESDLPQQATSPHYQRTLFKIFNLFEGAVPESISRRSQLSMAANSALRICSPQPTDSMSQSSPPPRRPPPGPSSSGTH